jgi:hypothetical protein
VPQLLRAELIKLRTTRVVYGLLAGAIAFTLLGVISSILTAGRNGTFALDTEAGIRNVIGSARSATVLVVVLGILGVTTEFRHGTIVQTFLVTPDRRRVVEAKLGTYALAGLAFAVVGSMLTLAIAVPWLAAKDVSLSLTSGEVVSVLLGTVLSFAIYGMMGVGVGTLIHNQVAAIIVALVWMQLVEGLLVELLPAVGKWLPGGAAASLAGYSTSKGDLLPMWAGGLLMAAYALALAVIGTRLTMERDVT